jgi:hypothetical protein
MKQQVCCVRKTAPRQSFTGIVFISTHILLTFLLFCQSSSWAKSFTVRSGYDISDLTPGNGLCVAYLIINPPYVIPFCTLRAAIQETNALPGADIIKLPSGTFHLTLEGQGEDEAQTGDLDITDDLTIIGQGAGRTFISADELGRVLDVIPSEVKVTISGVSFIRGKLSSGLLNDQQGGAGIRNNANLTLIHCSVEDNTVTGADTENSGAGIFNQGVCNISYSTLKSNLSAGEAGGILNTPEGQLIINASTLLDNTALNGGGVSNYGTATLVNITLSNNQAKAGGGINNSGQMAIRQSTIAMNVATNGAGINNSRDITMVNTLFAANNGENCEGSGEIVSLGGNLDDNNSCAMTTTDNDIFNIDPRIYPLENNGGFTLTHRIYISSPARDRGMPIPSIPVDQRGHSRLLDKFYDIGAFEASLPITPLLSRLLLVKQWENTEETLP